MRQGSGQLSVRTPSKPRRIARASESGFTLVEVLIVIAILLVLFGVVVVAGRATRDSTKQGSARRQLAQISAAISQYAAFWPAWPSAADKGWPHIVPNMVFNPAATPSYSLLTGFNDYLDLSTPPATWLSTGSTLNALELNANECLFYSLSTAAGKGPYVSAGPDASEFQMVISPAGQPLYYPSISGAGSTIRQRIVDPWGTPLRYFWVYRDANAYRGYSPVATADVNSANFARAAGFVLESAGPNKKFGNVWQLATPGPSAQEIADAEDNLIISP
jgi:prepilin-type N-terminal cleavage/methylation domain-containing protein